MSIIANVGGHDPAATGVVTWPPLHFRRQHYVGSAIQNVAELDAEIGNEDLVFRPDVGIRVGRIFRKPDFILTPLAHGSDVWAVIALGEV